MLLLSHLPPCVRLLCKSEMKEFTSLNAETFIQALRFISIVFPVILEDDECAELLLRSHLVANIMLCGERFNIPANEVALALTKACYHKPSLSEQLWITFLQASYAILSSPDKANSCKIYYATSLSDLTRCVPETDLINTYEHWLRVCLLGVGIYLPTVRQACTTAFRNIIPLSAVVVQTNHLPVVNSHIRSSSGSSGTNSDSVGVLAQVLSRSPLVSIASSTNALDITILRILSILGSSLFTSTSGSGIKDDATAAMPYLRPYQADGVTWLTHLRRCGLAGCLADEMGLGKSAQALVSLTLMRIEQVVNSSQLSVVDLISMNSESLGDIMTTSAASALPCLVICPASVVSHWEAEIRKFIPPSIFSPVKFTGKDIKLGAFI